MRRSWQWLTSSWLFGITIALLLAGTTMQREFGHYTRRDIDFDVYYFAAEVLHHHHNGDLYHGALDGNPQLRSAPESSPIFKEAHASGVEDVELYLYPPLTADGFLSLTRLSPRAAAAAWRFINLLLVLGSVVLLSRAMGVEVPSAQFAVFVVAAYSFFPVVEALALGQIAIVMLALWAISVVAYSRGYIVLSGISLGLASTLKITPVLVILLFVIWRDRRWLTAYFGTVAVAVLGMGLFNGWKLLETCVRVLAAMGNSVPSLTNKCIGSLVAWMYCGHVMSNDEAIPVASHLLGLSARVATISFYAVCLVLVWRRGRKSDVMRRTITFAVFALVSVLCSPVAWRHAYTVALVPLSLLWMDALRSRGLSVRTVVLALTSVATGSIMFDLVAGLHLPVALRLLSGSVWTLTCMLLCLMSLAQGGAGVAREAMRTGRPSTMG